MFKRLLVKLALAVVVALALAAPVLAGGWAVVTLDRLPAQVVAAEPVAIGFVVRQHGRTPVSGLEPQITSARADTGQSFTVTAEAEGEVGHYAARLTFPSAGTWRWSIDAFGFGQPMPPLAVQASPAPGNAVAGAPPSLPIVIGVAGLIGAAGALLVALRAKARWAFALVFAGALIGLTGFASATTGAAQPPSPIAALSSTELGQALFLAKGCVVCHHHEAVREARKELDGFSIGPNLTNLKADPDYLRRWLKAPSALKPGTEMPTLGLSDDEIEALVAFLTRSVSW